MQPTTGTPTASTSTRARRRANGHGPILSDRERVDTIKQQLRKWRWTIPIFIEKYVTAEKNQATQPQGQTASFRAKEVAAIMKNENIMRALLHTQGDGKISPDVSWIYLPSLEKELYTLSRAGEGYGRYAPERPVAETKLEAFSKTLETTAPTLTHLLEFFIKAGRHQRRITRIRKVFLSSYLTSLAHPKSSNNLSALLGLYMQTQGTRRRVLDLMARIGISRTPKRLYNYSEELCALAEKKLEVIGQHPRLVLVYDNFDYMARVADNQGLGHQDTTYHLTTGKAFMGIEMPETGLQIDMLDQSIPLRMDDVLNAAGNTQTDLQEQISSSLIAEAVRNQFPEAVDSIFEGSEDEPPWNYPIIDKLQPAVTDHTTLGLINANEGSINGTYEVLENIFQQLNWQTDQTDAEPRLQDSIKLIYGDQKTVGLIRTVRKESADNDNAFDRLQYLLPIPGLFHLKMTLIQAIETAFTSANLHHSRACLQSHRKSLQHKLNPVFQPPFSFAEKTVLQSYQSRIVAFLLDVLHEEGVNVDSYAFVHDHLCTLNPLRFKRLLRKIYDTACSPCVRKQTKDAQTQREDTIASVNQYLQPTEQTSKKKKNTNLPAGNKDSNIAEAILPAFTGSEERDTNIKYLQIVETYKMLCHAIRQADIGMLKQVIDRCILIFHARSHKNYAFITLWLKWLTDTKAAHPTLQRAILANGLFNLSGRQNSWFETDRANEYLNLYLKQLLQNRRNGTFTIDKQLERQTLLATYTGHLRAAVEQEFGYTQNTAHTDKTNLDEIFYTAQQCFRESLQPQSFSAERLPFLAPDLLGLGAANLNKKIHIFNNNVVHQQDHVIQPDLVPDNVAGELGRPETLSRYGIYAEEELVPGILDADTPELLDLTGLE